jgi:hypothetical protein
MSEILVEDGSTYPASVTVPEDGDARNAASVVVGFQALANRCAYMFGKVIDALVNGGTWLIGGESTGLTLDLSNGMIKLIGNDDHNIHLGGLNGSPGGVQFFANGNMAGHMFTAGRTGRANHKIVNLGTSSNQLISPLTHDTFAYLTGADIEVQVSTAEADLEDGDHFKVINKITSSGTITVKNTAGVTLHVVPLPSGGMPAIRGYTWHAATSSWVLTSWAVA